MAAADGKLNNLIGRQFRRNKYGISTWVDTIRDVDVRFGFTKVDNTWYCNVVDIELKGETHWYNLNEVLILVTTNKAITFLDAVETIKRDKQVMLDRIMNGSNKKDDSVK